MQCMHPSLIRNPAWDGSRDVPQSFTVPCGRCIGCRLARTREWSIRLLHELSYYDGSSFITLTYDDMHLPFDCGLHKDHLQKFFKRLRKDLDGREIKYFACGEYGDKSFRPHYHAIVFGLDPSEFHLVGENWHYGFVYPGTVSYDSIKYVAGYVQKKLYGKDAAQYQGRQAPFCISSQGIGYRYCLDNAERLRKDLKVTVNGIPLSIPRYYRKILGIDTLEYFEKTQEHRDEVEATFESRLPDVLLDKEVKDFLILEGKHFSRLQYEKNMEARLSLKERTKC